MSPERERVWSQVHKECNVRLFQKDEELIWRLIAHELAEKQRDRLAAGLHMPGYARVLCNNGQFEPMGSTHLIDGIDPEMNGVNRPAREALNELRDRKPWEVPGG